MPRPFPDRYTLNLKRLETGAVSFDCSRDDTVWPWLTLSPIHPILVQTINFWASIDSGEFLGTFDPEVWTALTQVDWECGAPTVGPPVRGVYSTSQDADRATYHLTFFDEDGEQVVRLNGQGVTFRTRNFEGWREEAKEKIVKPAPPPFDYASKEAVGVVTQAESFLAPLSRADSVTTSGLITKANGLRPAHPYIGGSGDHVNSTHMGEVGRQFGDLLLERSLINRGGEMEFLHYVELGSPFEVEMTGHDENARQFSLIVRQAGRDCTRIMMQYDFA
nr:hypothetical protein [Hyphomonas sp. Mor2]